MLTVENLKDTIIFQAWKSTLEHSMLQQQAEMLQKQQTQIEQMAKHIAASAPTAPVAPVVVDSEGGEPV